MKLVVIISTIIVLSLLICIVVMCVLKSIRSVSNLLKNQKPNDKQMKRLGSPILLPGRLFAGFIKYPKTTPSLEEEQNSINNDDDDHSFVTTTTTTSNGSITSF